MEIVLVRHAIAGDREAYAKTGEPDEARPLTEEGKRKMRKAASGLRRIAPRLDRIVSSPLKRAVQTAAILRKAYPKAPCVEIPELSPDGGPQKLLEWLRSQPKDGVLALVGHEPSLSRHAGWWMTGEDKALFELKKGGACLLEFDGPTSKGTALLRWLLHPSQLRRLA